MKLNISEIKNIELCYENFVVDIIEQKYILGFYIQRKLKPAGLWKNKITQRIKTFEIALKECDYRFHTDLTQVTINFNNGDFEHFHIVWSKDDWYDSSSFQKIHSLNNYTSLTSNCESCFLI